MLVETSFSGGSGALDLLPDGRCAQFERIKGEFLAGLHHELRTPLSGILGMADLLLETSLDTHQREYVSSARICAQQLLETLNATLEYSALSAGPVLLDEYEFCLAEAIQTAVWQHSAKAREKGIRLLLKLDERLPPAVFGDAQRYRQMLSHLVANAVKFTIGGEVKVRAALDDGHRLRLNVSDTGIGIEPERLRTIFDSFRQGQAGPGKQEGVGLGLAVVLKIASALRASIEVDSTPGQGTAFGLLIPLKIAGPQGRGPGLAGTARGREQMGVAARPS